MKDDALKKILSDILGGDNELEVGIDPRFPGQVLDAFKSYNEPTNHTVGTLVQWKPRLKNRKYPAYDEPVVVARILETPVIDDEKNSGSVYFGEKLTIVIGVVADGKFCFLHADGNRFEPYTGPGAIQSNDNIEPEV